jgi:hypothetical protein
MMLLNGFFIALHFIQTHLFYDGLAGDVPGKFLSHLSLPHINILSTEISALGSVVLFLVIILALEMPRYDISNLYLEILMTPVMNDLLDYYRRGLFFHRVRSIRWYGEEFFSIVKQYHGYVVGFGLVYNFWYHPMDGAAAHFTGFFFQFVMFVQSCTFYCNDHRNRYSLIPLKFH